MLLPILGYVAALVIWLAVSLTIARFCKGDYR